MRRDKCFWLEPSGIAAVSLRRFRFSQGYVKDSMGIKDYGKVDPDYYKCANGYGCNAHVVIGQEPYEAGVSVNSRTHEVPKDDPQWPKVCEVCGRAFEDGDEWQRNSSQLYRRDTGELFLLATAPVGAMWDAQWYKDYKGYKKHVDGIMLVVKTPGGDWCVDGPSYPNHGPGWERVGTIPEVTASPSILMPRYHGWLKNGWLEEC